MLIRIALLVLIIATIVLVVKVSREKKLRADNLSQPVKIECLQEEVK